MSTLAKFRSSSARLLSYSRCEGIQGRSPTLVDQKTELPGGSLRVVAGATFDLDLFFPHFLLQSVLLPIVVPEHRWNVAIRKRLPVSAHFLSFISPQSHNRKEHQNPDEILSE